MSKSILNTIGNTPLVEIKKLNINPKVRVLAKLEYFNPGGSIKDRPALFMIEAAEKSGELNLDKTVLEATSGNTGIGLALVCGIKGYRLFTTHYRNPITFSKDRLIDARRSLKRLDRCIHTLQHIKGGQTHPDLNQLVYDIKQGFTLAMDDDLNIAAAMASLFGSVKKINILALEKRIDAAGAAKLLEAFRSIDAVLGFIEFDKDVADPAIQELLKTRNHSRSEQNWELADRIRDQIRAHGIIVQDEKP